MKTREGAEHPCPQKDDNLRETAVHPCLPKVKGCPCSSKHENKRNCCASVCPCLKKRRRHDKVQNILSNERKYKQKLKSIFASKKVNQGCGSGLF
jgi:hypothetical protein